MTHADDPPDNPSTMATLTFCELRQLADQRLDAIRRLTARPPAAPAAEPSPELSPVVGWPSAGVSGPDGAETQVIGNVAVTTWPSGAWIVEGPAGMRHVGVRIETDTSLPARQQAREAARKFVLGLNGATLEPVNQLRRENDEWKSATGADSPAEFRRHFVTGLLHATGKAADVPVVPLVLSYALGNVEFQAGEVVIEIKLKHTWLQYAMWGASGGASGVVSMRQWNGDGRWSTEPVVWLTTTTLTAYARFVDRRAADLAPTSRGEITSP